MSLGESYKSRNGGVSEFLGLLRSVSMDVAATEASLDKKGSLGLRGGVGILVLFIALKLGRLEDGREDDEEQQIDEAIGKQFAMDG